MVDVVILKKQRKLATEVLGNFTRVTHFDFRSKFFTQNKIFTLVLPLP